MKRFVLALLAVIVAAANASGAPAADSQPAKAAESRPGPKVIQLKHLRVDLAAGAVVIDAEVNMRSGAMEFLLCGDTRQNKKHESILVTKAAASSLHTGLLLLGLTPGKPAQWSGEHELAAFLPPRGARLKITFRWRDKTGKAQEADASAWLTTPEKKETQEEARAQVPPQGAEMRLLWRWTDSEGRPVEVDAGDWLNDPRNPRPQVIPPETMPLRAVELKLLCRWKDKDGKARELEVGPWAQKARTVVLPKTWVFVGSDVFPDGSYWADEMGELISVSNFASSVIDVPFESTNKNDLLDFVPNTNAIPDKGTPVEVVITALPDAAKAEDARETLEIDRFGRMRIEGKPISRDKLSEWANQYVQRHAKGMVVIRVDGLTPVDDIEKAKDEFKLGGVREFQEQHLLVTGYVMPRTGEQAQQALREWRTKFENPKDYINEPAVDAETALKLIKQELAELDRLKALGMEYELHLRQAMEKYKASTRPSGREEKDAGGPAAPAGEDKPRGKE
jgi:biopolymer transport protein ExbD